MNDNDLKDDQIDDLEFIDISEPVTNNLDFTATFQPSFLNNETNTISSVHQDLDEKTVSPLEADIYEPSNKVHNDEPNSISNHDVKSDIYVPQTDINGNNNQINNMTSNSINEVPIQDDYHVNPINDFDIYQPDQDINMNGKSLKSVNRFIVNNELSNQPLETAADIKPVIRPQNNYEPTANLNNGEHKKDIIITVLIFAIILVAIIALPTISDKINWLINK